MVLPEATAYPDLPLEPNERVEYWIRRFTTDQRPTFELFLTQEGAFGDLIRDKLRSRGMPDRLLYLAMIESGLRPRATSRVEAAGVWQFMGPTAEAYGLRVDQWKGDSVYWQIRHLLPFETREYVPRLLAAAFLADALHENGFHQVRRETPYEFDRVWVPGGTTLWEVAQGLRVDRDLVWALNPHLIQGRTPPGQAYPLRVPVGSAFQVVASLGGQPWSPRLTDD